jgi:hypothetical protein
LWEVATSIVVAVTSTPVLLLPGGRCGGVSWEEKSARTSYKWKSEHETWTVNCQMNSGHEGGKPKWKVRSGNRNGNMDVCENIFGIEKKSRTRQDLETESVNDIRTCN